ncbi:MAG: hypothetical protein AAF399_18365, partial [Bacteroidota bacterium]
MIYRSTDLGMTWSSFAEGLPADATLSGIKQAGKILYVSTDDHGIFLWEEAQASWQPLPTDQLAELDINCLEVDQNQLVIGTLRNGILVSDDAGKNWRQASIDLENVPIRAFIRFQGKLYAGTDSGIFLSLDMGKTWSHGYGPRRTIPWARRSGRLWWPSP